MAKRLLDVVASSIGLLALSPFFILIALVIVAGSRGPVFFLQERVGRGGVVFRLFKFRTMVVGADRSPTIITVGKRDARITSVGYYLRKFKIDGFPQLINVLTGTMSLVGPRPELKKFTDLYSDAQKKVLSVKPGVTDLASIRFRKENEMLEGQTDPIAFYVREIMPVKLEMNLEYIARRNFWFDVRIIFQTVVAIFK